MLLYSLNLILLIATGVWLSLWFHHNSEWFPLIGGLLGLGSFFAWIAFVTNLLTDERKARYQELFDTRVLSNPVSGAFIVAFNLALIGLFPASNGGLKLTNTSATSIELRMDGDADPLFIGPNQTRKYFVPVPFLGSGELGLQINDAPALSVPVHAFERSALILPDAAWRRPLVLIRPRFADYDTFASRNSVHYLKLESCEGASDASCRVLFNGLDRDDRYFGTAFIVGTKRPVTLPQTMTRRWQALGWRGDVISLWSTPRQPTSPTALKQDDRVRVSLLEEGGNLVCTFSHIVSATMATGLVHLEVSPTCP